MDSAPINSPGIEENPQPVPDLSREGAYHIVNSEGKVEEIKELIGDEAKNKVDEIFESIKDKRVRVLKQKEVTLPPLPDPLSQAGAQPIPSLNQLASLDASLQAKDLPTDQLEEANLKISDRVKLRGVSGFVISKILNKTNGRKVYLLRNESKSFATDAESEDIKLEGDTEPEEQVEATVDQLSLPDPLWTESEAWLKLPEQREELAKLELESSKNKDNKDFENKLKQARNGYESLRAITEENIKQEELNKVIKSKGEGATLSPEEELALNDKVNEIVWKNLIVEEQNAYKQAIYANRKSSIRNKILEEVKDTLGGKWVQWYMGQSRPKKLAITTAFVSAGMIAGAGLAGATIGSAMALGGGVAIQRLVRGAVSAFTSGIAAKQADKFWSAEKLQEDRKQSLEDIKNAKIGTLEEKTEAFKVHNEYFDKKERNMALQKAAVTIAAGAGAGVLTGLQENFFHYGLSHLPVSPPKIEIKPSVIDSIVPKVKVESIFSDPSVMKLEVEPGSSRWSSLEHVLKNSEKFNEMSQAQKINVVANFNNELAKDPTLYGFRENGSLFVGDKLDFTKLFEDKEKTDSISAKAMRLTPEQSDSIVENTNKINSWVKTHPDEIVTSEKVNEILSYKPDATVDPAFDASAVPAQDTITNQPVLAPIPQIPEIKKEDLIPPSDTEDYIGEPLKKYTQENLIAQKPISPEILDTDVEKLVNQGLDAVYAKKGLFGNVKTAGFISEDWKFMKDLNAKKVLQFYSGDSANSGLSKNVADTLDNSEKHRQFFAEVRHLIDQSNGTIKPYENDNMYSFLKKLVAFGTKNSLA